MVRATSNTRLIDDLPVERVIGDVTDAGSLPPSIEGVDVIFHVAGLINAVDEPAFMRVNAAGTASLVDAVLASSSPPVFVNVSSVAAAGPSTPELPRANDGSAEPLSAYGRSKRAGELELARLHGVTRVANLRPPIIYGPGDTATLPLFRLASRGISLRLSGADAVMSFVHVDDLCSFLERAALSERASGTHFATGPEDATIPGFCRAIAAAAGKGSLEFTIPRWALSVAATGVDLATRVGIKAPPAGRDKLHEALAPGWSFSNASLCDSLAWSPAIELADGTASTLRWFREQRWL
jgi:nucleoside-diphosphate-sugar epimerase